MRQTLIAAFAGLLLGAAMHIGMVLLVPFFAVTDAWTKIAALGPDGMFHVLLHRTGGVPAARGMDVVVDQGQAHAAVKRTK